MIKIDKQNLHKLITSLFKDMYGRGAENIQISIHRNRIVITINYNLNYIEKQLLDIDKGKDLVIDARMHIFNAHLEHNKAIISKFLGKDISNYELIRSIKLNTTILTIHLKDI